MRKLDLSHFSVNKVGNALEKRRGIEQYKRRREAVQKLNLTSDLLSSVVFEDRMTVQDVLKILKRRGRCEIYVCIDGAGES